MNNERRINPPIPDKKLYKLPKDSIETFIESERRHDELDRLREVSEQKRVWFYTFSACTAVIILLLLSSTWGIIQR